MSGSGQTPPRPTTPSLTKEGGKKMTKTELKRRVDYVADVLRRVYALNRGDVTVVSLPVTARNELQQSTLRQYLSQPENIELVNNIYERRTSVVGGTSENLAISINPIVYPQIFRTRQQQQQMERQQRETEEADANTERIISILDAEEAEANIERITSILDAEEQQPAQFIKAGRITPKKKRVTERRPVVMPRLVQPVMPRLVQPVPVRQAETGTGLFAPGEAERLEREAQRINEQNQNRIGIIEPVTANVPADPEQQILQEAQQGQATLPALSNNQEVINAFANEAPEAIRPSVRNLIQGNVDADTVTDDVLAYVLNKATGIPAKISKPYIKSLLDTFGVRVNQLTKAGRIRVQLAQELTQYVSDPELTRRRTELERQFQNIYDASSNLPLQFRNDIRRISTLDYVIVVPSSNDEPELLEEYNQYEQGIRGYQQRLLRAVQNNNANGVAGILNEMRAFYNGIFDQGRLTSQSGGEGGTRMTEELASQEGMLRLASSITPAERRREQVREIFRTSTGDDLQRRIANLYQEITDEIASLPKSVLDSYTSKERAINNIFGVVEEETDNLGQQVGAQPVTRDQVIEAEERTQTARERAETVRAGQTGASVGGAVGAGVVSAGEVAAGLLGSSVGALGAGLVGGGAVGATAGLAAQRMGAGKGAQLGSAVGAGLLAGGAILAGRKGDIHLPGVSVREEPISIPTQVVEQEEQNKGKGTVRPKFIIPSASILDQTDSQIQADLDEFSAFDYVIPTSEGAIGNIKDNPLKQQSAIEYRLRFDGAGVDITSLFGQELRTTSEELKQDFIGDTLDKLPRLEVGVMEEKNLVGVNIVSPYRWDSTVQVPGYRDPYRNYTRVTDLDYKINKSQLYGVQY